MCWLILLVSAIRGGSFGGYGVGGKNTLSVGTRGATLGGDGVSCYIKLGDSGVAPSAGDSGYSGTLGSACSVGADGLGCPVGAVIGLSVPCYVGGGGLCCSGAMLVLKMSANFPTTVVDLGPYSKKGVVGPVLIRIVMRSRIASEDLSCDDRAGIATFLGNNWTVSEIRSPPVDVM